MAKWLARLTANTFSRLISNPAVLDWRIVTQNLPFSSLVLDIKQAELIMLTHGGIARLSWPW